MQTLTIRLSAPLQAYGNEASFNRRTSWGVPSKSAVLGLVAAALGLRRDDSTIASLNELAFATRTEQPGRQMTDFQIVEYQKNANKFTKKLSYRDYLQDAVFMVALGTDDDGLFNKIEYVLKHPRFQLFLGRRSCPPAGALQINSFAKQSPVQVLENLPWQASTWFQQKWRKPEYNAVITADADLLAGQPSYWQKDLVGSFSQKNRYHRLRQVAEENCILKNPYRNKQQSEHDIMANL